MSTYNSDTNSQKTFTNVGDILTQNLNLAEEIINKIITRHKMIHAHLTKIETQLEIFGIATKSYKFVEKALRTNKKLLDRNLLIIREFSDLLEDLSN